MKKIIVICFFAIIFNCNVIYGIVLNQIAAYVDDQIVTSREVQELLYDYLSQGFKLTDKSEMRKIIMKLVEKKLISNLLKRYEINLRDDDIKRIVENKISEARLSFPNEEEFSKFLKSQNLTLTDYYKKLFNQIKNSDEIKHQILYEQFLNSRISSELVIPKEELYLSYDYSIILVKDENKVKEILLNLRRGDDFDKLVEKYSITKKKNRIEKKDFGESLLAIETAILNLNEGDISEITPIFSESGKEFYGYGIIRLNKFFKNNRKYVYKKIAQENFKKKLSKLSKKEKKQIPELFDKYKEKKEKRLFTIKYSILKNKIVKNIWDAGFIKIN